MINYVRKMRMIGDIPGLGTVNTPYTQSWHLGKSFLLDIVYIVTHIKSK